MPAAAARRPRRPCASRRSSAGHELPHGVLAQPDFVGRRRRRAASAASVSSPAASARSPAARTGCRGRRDRGRRRRGGRRVGSARPVRRGPSTRGARARARARRTPPLARARSRASAPACAAIATPANTTPSGTSPAPCRRRAAEDGRAIAERRPRLTWPSRRCTRSRAGEHVRAALEPLEIVACYIGVHGPLHVAPRTSPPSQCMCMGRSVSRTDDDTALVIFGASWRSRLQEDLSGASGAGVARASDHARDRRRPYAVDDRRAPRQGARPA